jgi:hypothetical protein
VGAPTEVLVRAIGPSLALPPYNVSGPLNDSQLALFVAGASTSMRTNDDWGSNLAAVETAVARTNVQALARTSKDAAIMQTLNGGAYTAHATGVSNATGVTLVEIYDARAALDPVAAHFRGLSARGRVGSGDAVMIVGLSIVGSSPKQVLIRGVGPTLAGLGVPNTLSDPKLEVYSASGTLLATNDNWATGGDAWLSAAFNKTGTSALSTKDSALLLTLPPGGYTAILSGVGGAQGIALLEIYSVNE